MTTTKFTFTFDNEIATALEQVNQPAGLSPLNALKALAETQDGRVEIEISSSLLPPSYTTNPSQLAKYLSVAKVASVRLVDQTFHIIFDHTKQPKTFIRRLETRLLTEGTAYYKYANIPDSYNRDPRLVGRVIKDLQVSYTRKQKGIVWYITVDK